MYITMCIMHHLVYYFVISNMLFEKFFLVFESIFTRSSIQEIKFHILGVCWNRFAYPS